MAAHCPPSSESSNNYCNIDERRYQIQIYFRDKSILITSASMSICWDSSKCWDWVPVKFLFWHFDFDVFIKIQFLGRNAWNVNFCMRGLKHLKIKESWCWPPPLWCNFTCLMYPLFLGGLGKSLERPWNKWTWRMELPYV